MRDAELAYALFVDQSEALQQRVAEHPDEAACLHFLLAPENGKGGIPLRHLRCALRPSLAEAAAAWQRACAGKVCITGQRWLLEHCLPDPGWHKPLVGVRWRGCGWRAAIRCCRPGSA